MGWWLNYDALHQRLWGDFVRINGQLGPWADLVQFFGINPLDMSWFFIVLGCGLLSASFGLYFQRAWGYTLGIIFSSLGLLYLGFGTPIAALCLILLWLAPTRAYVFTPPPPP